MSTSIFVEHIQQTPKLVKEVGDTLSVGSLVSYVMGILTPFFEFLVIVATASWFILRCVELTWNLVERWKKKKGD